MGEKIAQKQFSGEKMAFLNIRVQLFYLEIQRSKTTIEMIFATFLQVKNSVNKS